jgi:iron complex transport system ATP-binding protein
MTQLSITEAAVRLGDKQVLQNISAAFETGHVTVIVGPNGAGKSTLLSCLAGLRRPDRGSVSLNGESLHAMPVRQRAQRIGFLPQIPEVAWAIDVRTLVGLGRTPFIAARGLGAEDDAAVDNAMALADVAQFAARNVQTLSGGERGRVLLARALAGSPQWLLADEPFAGLDPGHQIDAGKLFMRMAKEKGCGVIVTLHDLHMALHIADRVVVLAEGGILADGPPVQSLAPDILARAYGVESRFWTGQSGPMIEILGRRA